MSRAVQHAAPPTMQASRTRIQRSCACGSCDKCRKRKLQRDPLGAHRESATPTMEAQALHGGGAPLSPAHRARLEPFFGTSFADVRVHDDAASHRAATSLQANAFTWGQHIHFGAGRYDPSSSRGLHLLAHELTHTIQQRGSAPATAPKSIDVDAVDSPMEREADASADAVVAGRAANVRAGSMTGVQRQAVPGAPQVQAPASPPGCTLAQHNQAIEPAVRGSQEQLRLALERLDAFLRAPADPANAAVREALHQHFNSTDPAIARRVRARLQRIRNDMVASRTLTVECHDMSDGSCHGGVGAYVLEQLLVFCPIFFDGSPEARIETVTHEMAHTLSGLDHTVDRAYSHSRALPHLSTAEALNNAQSYAMFTQEVATGRAVRGHAPADRVEDCNATTQPLVRRALGILDRWNDRSQSITNDQRQVLRDDNAPLFNMHLGNSLPATRAAARTLFATTASRLFTPIDVRCDDRAGAECGAARHAYKGSSRQTLEGLRSGTTTGLIVGGLLGLGGGAAALIGGAGLLFGLGVLAIGLAAGALIGAVAGLISGALTRRDEVRVCPSWASLPSPEDRAESLLAAIYETYGAVDAASARRHAALARALYERYTQAPPPV